MRSFLALSFVIATPLAYAQDQAQLQAAAQQFAVSAQAAAAAAIRPGDEKLSCEQLQSEFMALVTSPSFKNFATQQAASLAASGGVVNAGQFGNAAAGASQLSALSQLAASGQLQSVAGANAAALAGAGAATAQAVGVQADAASQAVDESVAEQGKKKGGFMKKLGTAGKFAGAAGGLVGLGGLPVSSAGAIGAAGAAASAAGAAGAAGAGNAASAVQAGAALGALGGGGSNAAIAGIGANVAAGALANQRMAAAPGLDPSALQAAGLGAGVSLTQISQLSAISPELMRGARLMELGSAKGCGDWAGAVASGGVANAASGLPHN